MYKGTTKEERLQNFIKYMHDWETQRLEYKNWKCGLPIIGVFFQIRVSNKLGKITDEYTEYLNMLKTVV